MSEPRGHCWCIRKFSLRRLRNYRHHLLTQGCGREDSIQHPLGFALPPHTDEVDGNSGGDDAETDRTLHWSLPEGDDDEEEAGEHETHRQQNIYLDWSLQLWLLITEPHHPNDGHGDAEPVEEAEEVNDREDVVGEGVEQRHHASENE